MSIEALLEDALRESAPDVVADPASRDLIALRLTADAVVHRPRRGVIAAAAASVLVVAGVGAVVLGGDRGRTPAARPGVVGSRLPGTPLPPSQYFVGRAGNRDVVVRASTGRTVAILPDVGGQAIDEPQLSPDGRRAYGTWADATRLGYLDLIHGRHVQLAHRPGSMNSATLSADGSTLAYQWTPVLDGNDVSSIIVRTLASGAERVLSHAPAGPQAISLALSPDGRRLALVRTDRIARPVWIVGTSSAGGLAHPVVVTGSSCGSGNADEPRWTARGLFTVRHCVAADGTVSRTDLMAIDVAAHRAHLLRRVGSASTFFMTVVGRLFVTSDESRPDDVRVTVRDPARGWASRPIRGLDGLAVSGSE